MRLALSVALVGILVGGCGSSSAQPSVRAVSASSDQAVGSVVAFFVDSAATGGITLDPVCVRKLVSQFSTADLDLAATAVATTGTDPTSTEPKLSPAGQALAKQIFSCISSGIGTPALVDQVVALMLSQGGAEAIDETCLRSALSKFPDSQLQRVLAAQPGTTDPQVQNIALLGLACLKRDGSAPSLTFGS
jgi:hypothetical protein